MNNIDFIDMNWRDRTDNCSPFYFDQLSKTEHRKAVAYNWDTHTHSHSNAVCTAYVLASTTNDRPVERYVGMVSRPDIQKNILQINTRL